MKGCLSIAAVFIGLFFLIVLIGGSSDQPRPRSAPREAEATAPAEPGSETDAFIMSRRFVEDRLKAPRTARFPHSFDDQVHIESLGKGRWRVRAFVDAENSFGGEVRTPYKCVLRTTDGETWYPEVVELYE